MISTIRLVLVSMLLIKFCNGCPTSCICKWKNGKQTVECINKDLLIIPEEMDSGTQVLEFSGNNIATLHKEKFLKMDLINLQRIYMSRCHISKLEGQVFKGLTNLVELDLSHNLLNFIPTMAFSDCPSLMKLTLSHNPIKALGKAAFMYLTSLTTLELNNCEISTADATAFQGLHKLEWLWLQGNELTAFGGTQHLPVTLKGIQLQENPWECDCHILELHAWLRAFKFPLSVEPACQGPLRLAGRAIKSVPATELACMADIIPKSIYLEIEEGRNISLSCQVHGVPEAKVSWWYQGQLLQNDTVVAPGVHLLYYIEEGSIDKRSELFIYNANAEDNGTYICNAENPAGIAQANFTIRIIVKHDPQQDINEIPFELILIVISVTLVSTLIIIFAIILSIIRCHRRTVKKKRNESKEAMRNTTKDNLLQENTDDSDHLKDNSNMKLVNHDEGMMLYTTHSGDELLRSMSPIAVANQLRSTSPTAIKCTYPLEQNPDLINGTESIGRCRDQRLMESHTLLSKNNSLPYNLQPIKSIKGNDCNLCVLSPDVHLNPVGLLKTPRTVEARSQPFNSTCYRTLPYNRSNKRQTAANPIGRYSREAEFLSRSNQPASYEHFGCDVRYTADGYPVRPLPMDDSQNVRFVSSPPESHKSLSSTSTSEPCCSSSQVQWPPCMPANLHTITPETVIKKCVGAQTDNNLSPNCVLQKVNNKILDNAAASGSVCETLTESPDEGFEGDS